MCRDGWADVAGIPAVGRGGLFVFNSRFARVIQDHRSASSSRQRIDHPPPPRSDRKSRVVWIMATSPSAARTFFRATLTSALCCPYRTFGWRSLRVACRSLSVLGPRYRVRAATRRNSRPVSNVISVTEWLRCRRLSGAAKRIDYPSTTALTFAKASREERKVNTRDSRSRGYHSCCTCCGPSSSRRGFLAGLRALCAALVFPTVAARGQTNPPLIDTHLHFYPPEYQKLWLDYEDARKQPHFSGQVAWTRSKVIEDMDQNGLRAGILSLASTPGVWFDVGPAEAGRLARTCNEYAAEMMRDHPGRFGLFATLSMLDVDATLKEIEYAFDSLKADGIGLQSSYGDKWLGNPAYKPVPAETNRPQARGYCHT